MNGLVGGAVELVCQFYRFLSINPKVDAEYDVLTIGLQIGRRICWSI